ncbi:MAG TPA: Slp family lipoprotein [Candidatus Competibacteraceae bacterium]|nr:Slp family lipoprotein [Candidatus Competibacteraceae bacterium]MCP5134979.1 Slp family lipoprotein [Gammaproteobacteria bacterium]HRY19471.1 Slp family lipoprotein [Candidatus Competibacteraceae bacterium]
MNQNLLFRWLGPLLFGWLAGCAVPPPIDDPIQDADFQGPPLAVVRAQPDAFLQMPVRWGGVIARVDNRHEGTELEIVEQPLDRRGWPVADDDSAGRFLAQIPGFLDPAIYAVGRPVTVVGLLTGTTPGQVGDYRTTFPVVTVDHHRLWPERRTPEVIYVPDPYWYGPVYPWGYRRRFW